jgi:hypothetical protein
MTEVIVGLFAPVVVLYVMLTVGAAVAESLSEAIGILWDLIR